MTAKINQTDPVTPGTAPLVDATAIDTQSPNTSEAKSRFSAALDEAKAGAAALGDEAKLRGKAYSDQAKAAGEDYAAQAKTKGVELAAEGKKKTSEALSGLSKVVEDNATFLDEKFGAKYGDYARSTAKSLQENAQRLDEKSFEELSADAREAVRKSPATAVGVAALVGFFFARMFSSK